MATPPRRTVQDDTREQQLARLLRLSRPERRTGHDARDENDNPYELKTTTTANVTTGRDVGLPYLNRLRNSYMVVARGSNTDYGFQPDAIYFLSPAMLEGWIVRIEQRLGGDAQLVDRAVEALRQAGGFTDDELDKLIYLGSRGLTLNNPKIPWAYVTGNGVLLQGEPSLHLRDLVAQHPLPTP
jgi:hypothetical protein